MNFKKLCMVALISSATFSVNAVFQDDAGGERDVFSIFDSNNDGKVSMTEVVEAMMKIVGMDRNGDHYISRQELEYQENYSHWMAMFDFNKDGALSIAELPKVLHGKMHKMDKNNDGQLTIDELTGEVNIW